MTRDLRSWTEVHLVFRANRGKKCFRFLPEQCLAATPLADVFGTGLNWVTVGAARGGENLWFDHHCGDRFRMLTQSIGQAAADPLLSRSGLYEVISRLELPHLERWAIDKKTWVCLFSRVESHAIPLPVLSGNNPFASCSASNFTTHAGTFQNDILCPGRGAAKAHAIDELGPDKFAGRIAMVMEQKT